MKVVSKKLGRHRVNGEQVDGLAIKEDGENLILIDSRAKKKYHLYLVIHEYLHHLNWEWTETKVIKESKKLSNILWKQGYRKCDT